MYEVGYSDVKAFRRVFRKVTGMLPLEYRGRYNKEAALKIKFSKLSSPGDSRTLL
jgi:AraC-like DNA-binding protein